MSKLEDLKALCSAATPGPWTHKHRWGGIGTIEPDVTCETTNGILIGKEDAAFIVAAREALPRLIAVAEVAADILHRAHLDHVYAARLDDALAALERDG